jgi:tetratricopeptide (TPR) repeat protein
LLRHYDFSGAIQQSEAALKKFPKSAQLTLAAGVAYYGQDQTEQAIDKFLRTIELNPSVEQPYLFLSRIINRAHANLPVITQRFAEFQAKNPKNYMGYVMHAKALDAQFKEPGLAESLLRKSIALNGEYWESHYELAILLEKRGALEEAEKEFRHTTELNPREPSPHYRLCRVLARLGRTKDAQSESAIYRKVAEEYSQDLNRRLATVEHLPQ